MRHRAKRHLRGDKDRARHELRALAAALILYEKIETTQARARLTRSKVEKLITRGKKLDLAARRALLRDLPPAATRKVFEVLAPRFGARRGGYTRIIHVGKFKDGTKKVMLELLTEEKK